MSKHSKKKHDDDDRIAVDVPITLSVDPASGRPQARPDPAPAKPGQTVGFSAGSLAFKIVFRKLKGNPLEREISNANPDAKVKGTANGEYYYAVAIASKDGKQVFLEADCPSIIVN